jgi:hypothetical protein
MRIVAGRGEDIHRIVQRRERIERFNLRENFVINQDMAWVVERLKAGENRLEPL